MRILIGMDEAGYGPNLGPLVVAATAWQVDEGAGGREQGAGKAVRRRNGDGGVSLASAARPNLGQVDLYRALKGVISRSASDTRLAIADSKSLYKPGLGLRQLERGVHSVLRALDRSHACWSEMVDGCGADPDGHHSRLAWHDDFNCKLPIDATGDEVARLHARLHRACEQGRVRPLVIRARYVFPAEFNELTERFGSKGAALSHVTIGLLREVVEGVSGTDGGLNAPPAEAGSPRKSRGAVFAVCDKHGGRNNYTALVQHHFHEYWIEPLCEGAAESRYGWGTDDTRVEVAFRVKGEAFLPTALASMTAKYLRELAMRAFNEFWCARVPNLRPTAGYPTDAPRFKREIAALQRELGIDDHVLWRNR
jgi:hypothetical protein